MTALYLREKKTLHPVPKRPNIEIVPGSLKKIGTGKWTFKWKQGSSSVTNTENVNIASNGNSNFEYKWV